MAFIVYTAATVALLPLGIGWYFVKEKYHARNRRVRAQG